MTCRGGETKTVAALRLPQAAIRALLDGRHAVQAGATRSARGKRLAFIASLYSRQEFLVEKGVGPVVADRVEEWLKLHGLQFREVAEFGSDHCPERSCGSDASLPSSVGSA